MTPPPSPPPDSPGDSDDAMRVELQYDDDTPPSIAIVRAIAVIEDVDPRAAPIALGIRLHDQLDPEALDRLLAGSDAVVAVTVDLALQGGRQYAVQLRKTGQLVVQKST